MSTRSLSKVGPMFLTKKMVPMSPRMKKFERKLTIIFHYLCFLVMFPKKKKLAASSNINAQLLANRARVFH